VEFWFLGKNESETS